MSWKKDLSLAYSLAPGQISALEQLLDLLAGVSDRNLTAVTGRNRIIDIHFRDSLGLLGFREFDAAGSVVDIGSGAGFPGLPLAISRPEKSFTLVEANRKKCEFLASVTRLLDLANVEIISDRAEKVCHSKLRESFDLALARAVGPLPVVLEYALPLLDLQGTALFQRGSREAGDEATAAGVAALLGGQLQRISAVSPYPDAKDLNVWVFSKVSPTNARFPRRIGVAKKRPLKP